MKPLKGRPCVPTRPHAQSRVPTRPHAHVQPADLSASRFELEAPLSVKAVTSGRVSCCPRMLGLTWCRYRVNSVQTRQSRPDSGLGWSLISGKRRESLSRKKFLLAGQRAEGKEEGLAPKRERESVSFECSPRAPTMLSCNGIHGVWGWVGERERQTERERESETEREIGAERDREIDRERDRKTERERETETERER